MMASTLSRAPLAAGGAVASLAGQAGLWAFSQFMRSPMAYSAIIAAGTLTLMATGNALYYQHGRHPAPLFMAAQDVPPTVEVTEEDDVVPMAPLTRQQTTLPAVAAPQTVTPATTGAIQPALGSEADEPIGNSEVYEVQKKLQAMGLFQGKIDGYYGPMTAQAIRAFEQANGLRPQGALNRSVVDAILRANATAPLASIEPAPAPQPQLASQPLPESAQPKPVQQAQVTLAPAEQTLGTLTQTTQAAAPQAQVMTASIAPNQAQQPAVGAVMANPSASDTLLDNAGQGAANAFDMVAGALQSMTQPSQGAAPQQLAAVPPAQVAATGQTKDSQLVSKVQRGLMSLGFLAGSTDGVAGEATAKAIRNFEVYYNYPVTGRVTPDLIPMLQAAGAQI